MTQPPSAQQSKPFPWLKVAAGVGTGILFWKLYQELTDEEYESRTLPQSARAKLLADHYEQHGEYCPRCNTDTPLDDLEIDHVVSHYNGGRTSLHNSEVMCRPCNREKGHRNTLADRIRGRGGRRS